MQKSFLRRSLAGFQPYGPGDQPSDDERWIKLNTNESPIGPSPKVIEAIHAAASDSLRFYPSPSSQAARQAIANRFGVAPDMVLLGNGADELIELCFRAFAGAGDQVAFATPTYPLLEPVAAIHECEVSPHPMDADWAMPDSLREDPAPLKFVVNPNSPTGTWHEKRVIEPIVRSAQGVVVLDEAYVDFAPESRLDLLRENDNLVILRTMSKSYGLAGMRIGFALAHPDLIAAMDLVKDVYNLNRLAIVAAAAAIADLRTAAAALDPPRKPTGVRSGLPWASGKRHGNVFQAVLQPATASFETMRHRPADFELVFVDNWKTSTASTWVAGCNPLKPASALPWLASQHIAVVLTVPLFPNGGLTGTLPEGKARFVDVVEGRYDQVHQALAGGFAAPGVEVIGLRIGWEVNSGYPWSHQFCEGDYALWRGAYKRVAGL
jgi:histidinol-phosphate aminotransferase